MLRDCKLHNAGNLGKIRLAKMGLRIVCHLSQFSLVTSWENRNLSQINVPLLLTFQQDLLSTLMLTGFSDLDQITKRYTFA